VESFLRLENSRPKPECAIFKVALVGKIRLTKFCVFVYAGNVWPKNKKGETGKILEAKQERRGRPPKNPEAKLYLAITPRFTKPILAEIRRAAAAESLSGTVWVRLQIEKILRKRQPVNSKNGH
jgi:hypothetical protein